MDLEIIRKVCALQILLKNNRRKVNLKNELRKHLRIPIFYDNVTRVTALGELVHGIGKEYQNFICINAGYGIGAGIIINGAPFFGSNGFASEFGHIIVGTKLIS